MVKSKCFNIFSSFRWYILFSLVFFCLITWYRGDFMFDHFFPEKYSLYGFNALVVNDILDVSNENSVLGELEAVNFKEILQINDTILTLHMRNLIRNNMSLNGEIVTVSLYQDIFNSNFLSLFIKFERPCLNDLLHSVSFSLDSKLEDFARKIYGPGDISRSISEMPLNLFTLLDFR